MRISNGFWISKMFLKGAIAFVIFPAVQVKTDWRNNTIGHLFKINVLHSQYCFYILKHPPIDFCKQKKNIQASLKTFYNLMRPFHTKLENYCILEPEQWTNRNQEFIP
jgi:hypothetical protein